MFKCFIKSLCRRIGRLHRISKYKYSKDIVVDSGCEFGEYTYGEPKVFFQYNGKHLKTGKFCSIAADVKILLGGNHFLRRVSTYPWSFASERFPAGKNIANDYSKGDVIIGNDVWIGMGVTILSGVQIGDGAVIGAGAIVATNIPPYALAMGNPVKIVRFRFSAEEIAALLTIKWWDWSEDKINARLHLLTSESPRDLIISELGENWLDSIKK